MKKFLVVAVVLVLALAAAAGAQVLRYRDAARPGVRVLGTDVGGRGRGEIEAVVRKWLAAPVVVAAGGRSFHVPREWVVHADPAQTASRALATGSALSLVVPRRVDVKPALRRADGAQDVLDEISRAGRAPVSASVRLDGTTAVASPARTGLTLDRAALVRAVESGAAHVTAPFVSVRAPIGDSAARSAAATANAYLSAPVALDFHGAHRGALSPAQLARLIRFRAGVHRFAVVLDRERLAALVRPRLGKWIVRAHNAQFAVHGKLVSVVPSVQGKDVDPDLVAAAVSRAAHGEERVAHVELGPRDPDLTTAKAHALGIRRELVSFTTDMGESSSNRIHNVHLMADYIDGTIVRPGETFSFNDVVGPRTSERGFLEGQMIVGALVLPSIGGGVCQTATTLFNDAFELGLPILERTNHNLYLSHYPLGRDATVSWGGPDLKFKNDYANAILIKTSYTDSTLTFTMYGTPEGRRVESTTTPKTNFKPPTVQYAVDPRAPRGSVRTVTGSGAQGFDVSVSRTVYAKDGSVLRKDDFHSRYIPEGSTKVYGPGKTPPGPYFVIPET